MQFIGRAVRAGVVLAGILAAGGAIAQGAYPNKPLRLVIPFAPGGASDFVGRIMVPRWTELLGQSIVIDNKAGASGNIGLEAAARGGRSARPSGWTRSPTPRPWSRTGSPR